jgi:hypothetical protein
MKIFFARRTAAIQRKKTNPALVQDGVVRFEVSFAYFSSSRPTTYEAQVQ